MKTARERRDESAKNHGREKAIPAIRSMYPSESRGVMALHFSKSYEAGFNAGITDEAVKALVESCQITLDEVDIIFGTQEQMPAIRQALAEYHKAVKDLEL